MAVVLNLLAAAYVAQVPTPLRMNTDAIAYLTMAAAHHDGRGFTLPRRATRYPSGYPAIVAALEHVGLADSRAFVAVNEAMLAATLAVGVWLVRRWLDLPLWAALAAAAMVLLSRSTIRYSAIPGSEFAYMLVATLGLACLTRAVEPSAPLGRAVAWWGLGTLSLSSVWFRTIGVVLLPAIGWALVLIVWHRRRSPVSLRQWAAANRPVVIAAAAIALALGVAAGWVVSRTTYVHEGATLVGGHGLRAELWFAVRSRMTDCASVLTNFWYREVDYPHQRRLMFAGVVALPLTLFVVARRFRRPGPVDVYVAAYVAVLMAWPYKADNRFWLPVQLFVYAMFARELLSAAGRGAGWARPVAVAWAGLFVVTGVIVLAWSTRLTYAGDRFADRYDLEFMRDAYRAASPAGRPIDPAGVNPDLLAMIRRYGRPQFGP